MRLSANVLVEDVKLKKPKGQEDLYMKKFELTANGIAVISESGNKVEFDKNFEIISENSNKNLFWFKYFFLMKEEEREIVKEWYKNQEGKTENQKEFLENVKIAISKIDYDYLISTIEPSKINSSDKIFYEEGGHVYMGLRRYEWEKKAKEFAPEYNSDLANLYEVVLWYAYRIVRGYWSLEYVCDDSSSLGNYWNSPNSRHFLEATGVRKVGGFSDGIGNTYKIVKNPKGGFLMIGGSYNFRGNICPVGVVDHSDCLDFGSSYATGVLVLKKF